MRSDIPLLVTGLFLSIITSPIEAKGSLFIILSTSVSVSCSSPPSLVFLLVHSWTVYFNLQHLSDNSSHCYTNNPIHHSLLSMYLHFISSTLFPPPYSLLSIPGLLPPYFLHPAPSILLPPPYPSSLLPPPYSLHPTSTVRPRKSPSSPLTLSHSRFFLSVKTLIRNCHPFSFRSRQREGESRHNDCTW